MKTLALIALVLLVLWWCVLTVWAISSHRERVRLAASWTPENEMERQKLAAIVPHQQIRRKDYLIVAPFMIASILFLLPFHIQRWLVTDPFEKHDKVA